VNQSELLKFFNSHQLRAPKTAGPGAVAPLAPTLMQHWPIDAAYMTSTQ